MSTFCSNSSYLVNICVGILMKTIENSVIHVESTDGSQTKIDSILLTAMSQGTIYYGNFEDPDDCFDYKIDCLYYNKNFRDEPFYLYVSDGVGEIFASDYGKEWFLSKQDYESKLNKEKSC